jgi:basic membrane protein A
VQEQIGRYEIRREIGRGGMATVYLAYDPRFQRLVAIKVLPRQFTHDPKYLTRFEQEARVIATLEHPAIVPVHDFGEEDDAPYLVMRHMAGGSLRDRLRGEPLSLAQISSIFERLAPALDKAHQAGIVHRDIKPANILFDEDGNPYLADFGIARMAEASQSTTGVIGTPAYMSPEQVVNKRGQAIDGRADIYALGVILYELLTGEQPYEGETSTQQMMAHVLEPVPNVLETNPDLPPATQEVIDRVMAKEPGDRYSTAAELAQAVKALAGLEGTAEVVQSAEPSQPESLVDSIEEEKVSEEVEEQDLSLAPETPPVTTDTAGEGGKIPPARTLASNGSSQGGMPRWVWLAGALALLFLGYLVFSNIMRQESGPEPKEEPSVLDTKTTPTPMERIVPSEVPPGPEDIFEPTGDCAEDDVFCVGVVMVDDTIFDQVVLEGVIQAEAELGAQISIGETQGFEHFADTIDQFAAQDFDVIVTVGFYLEEATAEAARQYPDIDFIGVDQFQSEPVDNFVGLIAHQDQEGFLAGALAAMLTNSGIVAQILGTDEIETIVAFKEGFEGGARYILPDINIISTYHPGGLEIAFTDPDWGAEAARQSLDQGADVIFGAGGLTGDGALIEVAGQEGAYCIGVDIDQWLTLPDAHPCLVSSAVRQIGPDVFNLIQMSFEGKLPSGEYYGRVGLAPFHDHEDLLTQEMRNTLDGLVRDLQNGAIETGYNSGG